jgi:chemotaxis protein CheD
MDIKAMVSVADAAIVEAKPAGAAEILVGMGRAAVARKPDRLIAVLGSCVGVALYDTRRQWGGLAHVVLPNSRGSAASPGKFADTAVPHLLELLEQRGSRRADLIVWLLGGACMFDADGPMQIGDSNIKAVVKAVEEAKLPVVGKDLGGAAGRRVTLDCSSGKLIVEIGGKVVRAL